MRALRILAACLLWSGCYSAPSPDCGFVCGDDGACPSGYSCASDGFCHREGTAASLFCGYLDASVFPDTPDGPIDAPSDTLDTTAPTLAMSTPADAATGIARNTTITVVFSEPVMNVTTTTFTVDDGSAVTGAVNMANPTTFGFMPTGMLAPNATVTVTLDGAITDLAGNALTPAPTTFSFSTGN